MSQEDDSCIICFDSFEPGSRDLCTPNTCNHLFHKDCLWKWVSCDSTCPLCKAAIKHLNIRCYNDAGELEDGGTVPVEEKKQAWCGDDLEDDTTQWLCQACGSGHNEEVLLICDGCEQCFHTFCIGLDHVPDSSFSCEACSSASNPDLQVAIAASLQIGVRTVPPVVNYPLFRLPLSPPPQVAPRPLLEITSLGLQLSPPRSPAPRPSRRLNPRSPLPPPRSTASRKKSTPRPRRYRRSRERFDRHRMHILIKRRMRRSGIDVKSFGFFCQDRAVVPKSKPDEQEEVERLLGLRPEVKRNPWAYTKDPHRPAVENPLSKECLSNPIPRRRRDPAARRATPPAPRPNATRIPKRRRPHGGSSENYRSPKRPRPGRPSRDAFLDSPRRRESGSRRGLFTGEKPGSDSSTSGSSPIVEKKSPKMSHSPGPEKWELLNATPPPAADPLFAPSTRPPDSPELSSVGSGTSDNNRTRPSESRASPLQQAVERKVATVLKSVRREKKWRLSANDCKFILTKATNKICERLSQKPGIETSSSNSLKKRLDHREAKIQNLVLSYAKKRVTN